MRKPHPGLTEWGVRWLAVSIAVPSVEVGKSDFFGEVLVALKGAGKSNQYALIPAVE